MQLFFWRSTVLLAFAVLSSSATLCHAADAATDNRVDCSKAGSQSEMEQCASQALNKADAELNQTYVDYRNRLDQAQQNQIRDVQLAWIKYRDLSCKYVSGDITGSARGLALQSCLTDKTLERAKELKALASCAQGDLNCAH